MLDRSDVDTDQIIPKQFLKRIERTGFGEFLFYDWFRSGEIELEPHPILVTGRNFGSGSSREHAVWALKDFGFDAVIAPSFSDIFYSNCTKNGLLPVILSEEDCRAVAGPGEARIDLDDQTVNCAAGVFKFEIDEQIKHRLSNGLDDVAMTLRARRRRSTSSSPAGQGRRRARSPPRCERPTAMNTGPRDWDAETYDRVSDPQFEWGMEVLDRLELRRRRDRARRRLRVGPRHRASCSSGCRTAGDRRRRLAGDAREGPREPRRRARRLRGHGPRRAGAATSRSTSSSRPPPSTGSPTTTTSSAASARRCAPGGRLHAQCGGAGNVASLAQAIAEVAAATRVRRALRGHAGDVELRERRGHRGAPRAPPASRTCRCWLRAEAASTPERAARVHAHRHPRPAPRACCPRSCTTASSTRSWRSMDEPADPRLRPAQHRGDGQPAMSAASSSCPATASAPRSARPPGGCSTSSAASRSPST